MTKNGKKHETACVERALEISNSKIQRKSLGFGLIIAPKNMGSIAYEVFFIKTEVKEDKDSYIDDTVVNADLVPSGIVVQFIPRYGSECKPGDPIVAYIFRKRIKDSWGGGVSDENN
jgi:hypothetical protein